MASRRNALSSLIDPQLMDPDLFIGFHFVPTFEDGVRIVHRKNAGGELLPILSEHDRLFQCQPEQLKECYCFTKLDLLGNNKVNRTLWDGSGRWKNIKSEFVRADNNIGWVTKLVLHMDKNTPTQWHILEYKDKERPDAGRWVLCQIYKGEKNNDSGGSGRFPSASDIEAGQIYPSTSQDSSMWASGAREDIQHYEMGQCSNTQPDLSIYAAIYQNQIHGVDQSDIRAGQIYPSTSQVSSMNQIPGVGEYGYPPQGDVVNNPQQFPSCTYSNGGIDTFSGFHQDDCNGNFNADLDTSDIDHMDEWNEIINQLWSPEF